MLMLFAGVSGFGFGIVLVSNPANMELLLLKLDIVLTKRQTYLKGCLYSEDNETANKFPTTQSSSKGEKCEIRGDDPQIYDTVVKCQIVRL